MRNSSKTQRLLELSNKIKEYVKLLECPPDCELLSALQELEKKILCLTKNPIYRFFNGINEKLLEHQLNHLQCYIEAALVAHKTQKIAGSHYLQIKKPSDKI